VAHACQLEVSETPPVYLSGRRARQRFDDLDLTGVGVGRHLLPAEGDQLLRRRL
jgi:hypothetical protein